MSPEDISAKAASFLAALRSGDSGSPPDEAAPRRRAQELEAADSPAAPDQPPRPPTELALYIQTRMELLERKLGEAQAEALRANLLLQEREAAQRRAQKEVEDLFRTIKEQQRAAQWDAALRDDVAGSHRRIAELESRLQELQLRMVPAEDVLRALQDHRTGEALRREIEERVRRLHETAQPPAPPFQDLSPASATPPASPPPVLDPLVRAAGEGKPTPLDASDSGTAALLLAKVAELERALEEARRERDEERERRARWEKDMVGSFAKAQERWRKGGSAELVVEAALETMALAMKERDEAEAELKDALDRSAEQPAGSAADPILRARVAAARDRLATLQETLRQQMNIVQAWIEQNRAGSPPRAS